MRAPMTDGFARAIEVVAAVHRETAVWVRNLSGEGHAAVHRNRQAVWEKLGIDASGPVDLSRESGLLRWIDRRFGTNAQLHHSEVLARLTCDSLPSSDDSRRDRKSVV